MRTDIVAGAIFPDYELTDHTGTRLIKPGFGVKPDHDHIA
jgi:hypothetical protein